MNQNNIYTTDETILLISIFFWIIVIAFVVKFKKKQKNNPTSNLTTKENLTKSSREAVKNNEEENYFRKIYGLTKDVDVYTSGYLYSTSPVNPTSHELWLAENLVDNGFFNTYFIFIDYYFKNKDGRTSQIDVLAVGKRGVFVFESKDYSGWIFGNGNNTKWTQSIYGKSHSFYNPIKQNISHIKKLKEILGENQKYHSLIVFDSKAELKNINYIPKNTYVISGYRLKDAMRDIMKKQPEYLNPEQVLKICKKINDARLFCSDNTAEEHVKKIREEVTGEDRLYT